MHAKVQTVALEGLQGHIIEVEVFIAQGLPRFEIVGLAGRAIQESKERIRAAITSSGYKFPMKRITVNLAPADLVKSGPGYDLPIAVGILKASGQFASDTDGTVYWGELSLEGDVRAVNGALAIASAAKASGFSRIITSLKSAQDAVIVAGIKPLYVKNLAGLIKPVTVKRSRGTNQAAVNNDYPDLCHVRGQSYAKRALEISAAGRHNLLLSGTPGAGKTYLAHALAGILPDMSFEEQLQVTTIHSVAGVVRAGEGVVRHRPFRAPHHTCSHVALIGGGSIPRPGEVTLAHNGVLFLDEFTEFEQRSLESLRQPLQDKKVTIARASGSITYPAGFLLVAAMNPCKCGYLGDPVKSCTCSQFELERYNRRISGPLLDRISLQITIPRLTVSEMQTHNKSETSSAVRDRVEAARHFAGRRKVQSGSIENQLALQNDAASLLIKAVDSLALSQRSYFAVVRVGRTIADLEHSETVTKLHIEEALAYRTTAN